MVFRRGFQDIRAVPEEFEAARDEKCKFVPFLTPKKVTAAQGRVKSLQFCRMEQDDN